MLYYSMNKSSIIMSKSSAFNGYSMDRYISWYVQLLFTIDAHRHSYISLVSKLSVMYGLTLFIHIKIIIELLIISPLESNIIPNEH